MTELEQVQYLTDDGDDERKTIVYEYEDIVENLLRDLQMCKDEQLKLRLELELLRRENKAALEIARDSFLRVNNEQSMDNENYRESVSNLERRISIMEKEKDSVFQLWQIALKAVDTLEDQLKATQKDGKATKYYEEQVNNVKETYSEAIKALELKLLQAKENFVKHQSLWESNRQKIEIIAGEKNELENKLSNLQIESRSKEESDRTIIEALKSQLDSTKHEIERNRSEKTELQERLQETRIFAAKIVAKDEESKNKILEAIELVEAAVKEKDLAFEREARALEERTRIEFRLNNIVEEYTSRLDKELTMARENFERDTKKYILEMKELKAEVREKSTFLDRAQREIRLVEEELEKVRHGSEDFLQKSSVNILELEKKLQDAHEKIEKCEDDCRKKYENKNRQGEERIMDLEARLAASGDRLRRTQLYSSNEFDERIREADERTKEVLERYSNLERRLARALDERENLASELRNLQTTYDREISRRDCERRSQETRIRELQSELQTTSNAIDCANTRGNVLVKQIEKLQMENQNNLKLTANGNEVETLNAELSSKLRILQEKFDQRTKELSRHVETHQTLCRRWKDEAKTLTSRFQSKSKELRDKLNILRKENDELNKELLISRQQLAECRVQVLHRYDQGDGNR